MFVMNQEGTKIEEFRRAYLPRESEGRSSYEICDVNGAFVAKYHQKEIRDTVWEMLCIYIAKANSPEANANLFSFPWLEGSSCSENTVKVLPVSLGKQNSLNYVLKYLNLKFYRGDTPSVDKDGAYNYSDWTTNKTKQALGDNPPWVILEERETSCVVAPIINLGIDHLCGIWAVVLGEPQTVTIKLVSAQGVMETTKDESSLLGYKLPYMERRLIDGKIMEMTPTVQQLSDMLEDKAALRIIKGELRPFSNQQDYRALYNTLYQKVETGEKYYVVGVEPYAEGEELMLKIVLKKVTKR